MFTFQLPGWPEIRLAEEVIVSAAMIGHMMSEYTCNDVMGSSLIVPCSSVLGLNKIGKGLAVSTSCFYEYKHDEASLFCSVPLRTAVR